MVNRNASPDDNLNPTRLVAAIMTVGAGLLTLVAIVWSIARFAEISNMKAPTVTDFVWAVVKLFGACGLSLLLWGGAELLRKLDELVEAAGRVPLTPPTIGPVSRTPAAPGAADRPQTELLEQLIDLTREVRDVSLLSETERAQRIEVESLALAQRLEAEVPTLLREHRWQVAQQRVEEARARFPMVANWKGLLAQVEQARTAVEKADLETTTREVDDLTALGAWDRAMQAVRDLQRRHPTSTKAADLARRITIQRDKAAEEDRARLMIKAQEATNARDWTTALERVEQVLAKYPNAHDLEELRQQLPTLRKNAEIQRRQVMEAEIKQLIKEHRYGEALHIARRVVDEYPDSPQATVLRDQLPRLEQKAAEAF